MDRFFGRVSEGEAVINTPEELKHFKVKRVKKGDPVEIIDEKSLTPYLCEVLAVEKKRVVLKVLERLTPNVPELFIRLYQCVPVKVSTFDEIVEKVSEVGVSEIVPVVSKRSFQKLSVIKEKMKRWERIAKESMKQCGRHRPLKVSPPVVLDSITPREDFLNLFPFERGGEALCSLLSKELQRPNGVNLIIGPEGGFTAEEADTLTEKGFKRVSLGNFVLRAETAAVVASAVVYNGLFYKPRGMDVGE